MTDKFTEINESINYLENARYEIYIKNENTYVLNDIDNGNTQAEVYDKKELIELANTIYEELK